MAYSYITYVGDGDTRLFGIPFPYLKKEHVKVYINNVPYTDFIWSTNSTLEFASAPADGTIVRIQRETPYSAGMVKFNTSNILDPDNLNLTTNQLLYALQEAMDRLTTTIAIDNDNKYDAQNKVIKNVADPIDPTDAVNKRYIQPAVDQANASAAAAKTSETNAKASELRAITAENNAKNSEINAALSASTAKAYSDHADEMAMSAEAAALNARGSEQRALTSELNAKASELNAKDSELNAVAAANEANTYKQSAQASALAASTHAIDAADSATRANMSATEAAQSQADAAHWAMVAQRMIPADIGVYEIGDIKIVPYMEIPDGWLECNGAEVSRETYPELFAKIGTTFGEGNGVTTFNLPDLRGEFIRGWDHGRGVDPGREFGSNQGDAIRNITGTFGSPTKEGTTLGTGAFRVKSSSTSGRAAGSGGGDISWDFDASRVVPTANENRPRNVALMALIKAKNVIGFDPVIAEANADTLDGYHARDFALADALQALSGDFYNLSGDFYNLSGDFYKLINTNNNLTYVEAYHASSQSISANSTARLSFTTKVHDVKNEWDGSRFTAKSKGIYLFVVAARSSSSEKKAIDMMLRVNGTPRRKISCYYINYGEFAFSNVGAAMILLNPNDYVEVYCLSNYTATTFQSGESNTAIQIVNIRNMEM